MVVVGGKGSANTKRLAEVAREAGVPGFQVETEDELDENELSRFNVVGLTAGASTPNWMIRRVYDGLQDISHRQTPWTMLKGAIKWMVMSNLYVALGAGALTLAAARMQERWPDPLIVVANILFVFGVHTLTLMMNTKALSLNVPARARSFTRHRQRWTAASAGALIIAFAWGLLTDLFYGSLLAGLALVSLIYPVRISGIRRLPVRSLAEVPASKDLFMAAGWSVLIVILPLIASPAKGFSVFAAFAAFAMIGGLVFVRALLRDFRDIQADRMIGRETLPIALGTGRTRRILYITLVGAGAVMVMATLLGGIPSPRGYALLAPLAYFAACVPLFTRQTILQGFGAEFIIDAAFLITGVVALLP
jgi:4-hydroxy-3-methylbut-2-enyl diphosphate reductase